MGGRVLKGSLVGLILCTKQLVRTRPVALCALTSVLEDEGADMAE